MSLTLLLLLISVFFLVWTFFLTTASYLIPKISEKSFTKIVKERTYRSFYVNLHRRFFTTDLYDTLILSTSIGANIGRMGYLTFALFALYHLPSLDEGHFILYYFITIFLGLLFCDLISRLITLKPSLHFLQFFKTPLSFFLTLALPFHFWILKIIQRKKRRLSKELGEDRLEKFKETLSDIIQAADITSPLHPSDKKLLEAVLRFKDRIVREVMIPRSELFTLPTNTTLKEASNQLVQEGFSRIPIYRGNIDNIIGVLMFKDLFEIYKNCLEGKSDSTILTQPVGSFVKGVIYAPETKQVSQLLQEFRAQQMHMAIVVDEYGGTEGVVTIEDILEEIVGDISDEYDVDHEALYTPQSGGGIWVVDAKMNLFDAENTFNIHIPKEGDYDTIGGFIYHKLGEIPEPGTKLTSEGFELEILSVTERNVEKVRLITRTTSTHEHSYEEEENE